MVSVIVQRRIWRKGVRGFIAVLVCWWHWHHSAIAPNKSNAVRKYTCLQLGHVHWSRHTNHVHGSKLHGPVHGQRELLFGMFVEDKLFRGTLELFPNLDSIANGYYYQISVFPRCEYTSFNGRSGCEALGGHYNPIAGVASLSEVCWRATNSSYDVCFPSNLCTTVTVRRINLTLWHAAKLTLLQLATTMWSCVLLPWYWWS